LARRRPVAVEDRHEREEDRERRLAALRIRLYETAREIRTAGDWARCLHAAARLPGENWANVLLISSQRPGATMVMGYEAWRAAGRQVNRDEKGIEIFSDPRQQRGNPHGDEQAHSWRDARRVAYVWDLSQTSGKPIPAPAALPSTPGEVQPGLWDSLCWLGRREGFAVARISRVLDRHLAASAAAETTTLTSQDEDETPRVALQITAPAATHAPSPEPDPRILGVLADAEEFYVGQLASSWVPAYLRRRGLSDEVMVEWHVGYA